LSKTLIVGDLHLGKSLSIGKPGVGNSLNSRIVDQLNLLDWLYDQAVERHVGSIIFTGDICESIKPDYILIECFIKWLRRCSASNIEVHIIAGNHDLKRTGARFSSYLDLISTIDVSGIYVYKNINTIFRDGVGFTLLPFRDRLSLGCGTNEEALSKVSQQLPYELGGIPTNYSKVLVGHFALEGSLFVGDEFDNLARELMCPLKMFAGYDYVWMGHVHKPQVRSVNPYIAHIGSLDISDFGETDHNKIVVLFDTDDKNKFIELEVPSRPLRRLRVDIPEGFDTTEYVLSAITAMESKTTFESAIVKLEIKLLDEDASNVDRDVLEKAIYDLGAFYVTPIQESRNIVVDAVIQQHAIDEKIAPREAVKTYANTLDFDSDTDKQDFIDKAHATISKYESKQ
jgi:exonuclease SbcD